MRKQIAATVWFQHKPPQFSFLFSLQTGNHVPAWSAQRTASGCPGILYWVHRESNGTNFLCTLKREADSNLHSPCSYRIPISGISWYFSLLILWFISLPNSRISKQRTLSKLYFPDQDEFQSPKDSTYRTRWGKKTSQPALCQPLPRNMCPQSRFTGFPIAFRHRDFIYSGEESIL